MNDLFQDASNWILTDGRTPEDVDRDLSLRTIAWCIAGIIELEEGR